MPLRNYMIAHKEKKYFHPQKHIAHSIKISRGFWFWCNASINCTCYSCYRDQSYDNVSWYEMVYRWETLGSSWWSMCGDSDRFLYDCIAVLWCPFIQCSAIINSQFSPKSPQQAPHSLPGKIWDIFVSKLWSVFCLSLCSACYIQYYVILTALCIY